MMVNMAITCLHSLHCKMRFFDDENDKILHSLHYM